MNTNISARPVARTVRACVPLLGACAIGFIAGCASEPYSHVVSAPPPPPPSSTPAATVYTTPAPAPTTVYTTPSGQVVATPSPVGASSLVVVQAPPAAQQEVPSPRPTRDHVWVAGYWTWNTSHSRYEWMAGRWEIPPRVGAVFVPPRWQPEGSSWRFYEGYWD
jgi:hypothetical protein